MLYQIFWHFVTSNSRSMDWMDFPVGIPTRFLSIHCTLCLPTISHHYLSSVKWSYLASILSASVNGIFQNISTHSPAVSIQYKVWESLVNSELSANTSCMGPKTPFLFNIPVPCSINVLLSGCYSAISTKFSYASSYRWPSVTLNNRVKS